MTAWQSEYRSKTPAILGIVLSIVLTPIAAILAFFTIACILGLVEEGPLSTFLAFAALLAPIIVFMIGRIVLILFIVKLVQISKHNRTVDKNHEQERIEMDNANKLHRENEAIRRVENINLKAEAYLQSIYMPANNGSLSTFADSTTGSLLYEIDGKVVNVLQVYEDRCVLIAKTTARSYVAGSFFSGTKEFFYDDLVNIQFRPATKSFNGFLQFDYIGAQNIGKNNYHSENTFIYEPKCCKTSGLKSSDDEVEFTNAVMSLIYKYIHDNFVKIKAEKRKFYSGNN